MALKKVVKIICCRTKKDIASGNSVFVWREILSFSRKLLMILLSLSSACFLNCIWFLAYVT